MADTIGATVIVDLSLNQADYKQKAVDATNTIIILKDKQDQLRQSGQQLSVGYATLAQQIAQTTQQQKAYITLSQNQSTSDNARSAQLKLITNQLNSLTDAEKNGTAAGNALVVTAKSLKDQLNESGKSIGNFTGQVGAYTEGINKSNVGQQKFSQGITQLVSQNVPYGNSLINLVQGTNSLGGAFEGASIGAAGFVAAGAAIVAITAGIITHFAELTPNANKLSQEMAGIKGYFRAFVDDIGTGASFDKLGEDMVKTAGLARELEKEFQNLARAFDVLAVNNAQFDTKLEELNLQLRKATIDRNVPLAGQITSQIEDLSNDRYAQNKDALLAQYITTVYKATNTPRFFNGDTQTQDQSPIIQSLIPKNGQIPTSTSIKNAANIDKTIGFADKDDLKTLTDIAVQLQANEKLRIQVEGTAENRYERAKEAADRRAAARKLALQSVEKDRIKSAQESADATLTIREKEYEAINADVDKRKLLYEKYGKDTTNLEKERLNRIAKLDAQFRNEDIQTIGDNLKSASLSNAQTGKNSFSDPNASVQENVQAINNQTVLDAIDKQIQAISARIGLGEIELGNVLDSFVQKRLAAQKAGDQTLQNLQTTRYENLTKTAESAYLETVNLDNETLKNETANQNARLKLNETLAGSYENLFGTIGGLVNKNSTVGQIAFALEKSFAIARIIINAELEKSNIALATAELAAAAATNPFTIFAVPGILIAGVAEEAAVTGREIEQVAAIAAQTVGTLVSGHAKGGMISGPGSGTSDSIPARLSNGEAVMTAKTVQMFRPWLSDMNVAGGGKSFATGGLAGSYVPTLSNQINSDNAISRSLRSEIRGMKIYTAITDINAGQQRYAAVQQNGTF